MKKIISILLAICFIAIFTVSVSADNTLPAIEQGTINSGDGNTRDELTRIRTANFVNIADYQGVSIATGYELTNFVYDADKNFLGTSGWLGDGTGFTTNKLTLIYPNAVYLKFAIKRVDNSNITPDCTGIAELTFYTDINDMPDSLKEQAGDSEFTFENDMNVGFCQEGAIFNKKLFALSHDGSGKVYDLGTKEQISDIVLDKRFVINPHSNSVCFGAQYYDKNDEYPLLYVNVYNNYKNQKDRREGVCCVYRVIEKDGSFKTQLVQVIEIGFTEDLNLWKSLEGNKDERPYGNFVVDTDNNDIYAFVMRDKEKVTRFFKFDVPALNDGEYNILYGCNVVTFDTTDIKDQFDTEYFNYMQGCDYTDGKIISVEGFGAGGGAEPAIRIVDLKEKAVVKTYYPVNAGLSAEPEIVAVDNENGNVYYMAGDGVLRKLTCIQGKQTNAQKLVSKFTSTAVVVKITVIVVAVGLVSVIVLFVVKKRKKNKN